MQALKIKGRHPAGLSIHRDQAGVPHIKANQLSDVCWGVGYCHAVDRASQMLTLRILGQGRLCELLSDNEESLAIDTFFRKANWHQGLSEEVDKLPAASLALCQAYCDGFNQGLSKHRQWALSLAGYSPEPWRVEDSILGLRMTSYLTLAQSQQEIERLFIEMAQAGFSTDKLESLFPGSAKNVDREMLDKIQLDERVVSSELLWNIPVPRAMASNNWVVAGQKTQSGQAIMANDPHLEVNRLPNVWYEMALQWPENTLQGFGMPGLPAIVCGRSPELAWGVTYSFMDTVDSWVEQCRDGCYLRRQDQEPDQWLAFAKRREVIKRKKHPSLELEFYQHPEHGTLAGDPNKEGFYLSSRWSPEKSGAVSIAAMVALFTVSSSEQALQQLGQVEAGWNWVVADRDNNIGYQMSGLMPKRHPDWNGLSPAPGWDRSYDWQGFVAPSDLPRCVNPESGFLVTANNDLNHLGRAQAINMPMGDYRARRIEQLLAVTDDLSVADMQAIQMDVYSLQAEQFLQVLLPLIAGQSQADLLQHWDRRYDLDSGAAVLFELFYAELRKLVFGRQEFGEKIIEHLVDNTGVFIDFYQNFDRCMLDSNSVWFAQTQQADVFVQAFQLAAGKYQGQAWGDVNRLSFTNIIFQGKLPKFLGFDVADVPIQGGRATPHQGQIYNSAGRQTSFAPSIRLIADLAESDLHSCIAGGPSEKRYSPWYRSELDNWLKGKYKILKPEF